MQPRQSKTAAEVPVHEREVWRVDELAGVLGISATQVRHLDKEEAIPAPVWVGNTKTWRAAEVRDWLAAGCPERSRWTWKPSLVPKLDDLLADLYRQIRQAETELGKLQAAVRQNEQLLLEADQ